MRPLMFAFALAAVVASAGGACGGSRPLAPPSGQAGAGGSPARAGGSPAAAGVEGNSEAGAGGWSSEAGAGGALAVAGAGGALAVAGAGGSSSAGTAGSSVAGAGGSSSAVDVCGPIGDRYMPSSIGAMARALVGTWVRCSELGLFGIEQAHDAISVGADNSFSLLRYDATGALVPVSGAANQGRIEYIDTSSANGPNTYQVNFERASDRATATTIPVFSDVPRVLLVPTSDFDASYRYRRLEASGPNEGAVLGANGPAPGDVAQPGPAVACGPVNALLDPQSPLSLASLRGTWMLCSADGIFSQPQAGFFVGGDGRWTLLGKNGERLVPMTGLENKGRIDVIDARQANFVVDYGYTTVLLPSFTVAPRSLVADTGFAKLIYRFVP